MCIYTNENTGFDLLHPIIAQTRRNLWGRIGRNKNTVVQYWCMVQGNSSTTENHKKTRKPNKLKSFESYTKFALTATEIERALSVCDTTEKECIIRIGYTYGLRRTDMANLKFNDIDPGNNLFKYYDEKKNVTRVAPLTPDVKLCVQRHKNAMGVIKRDTVFDHPSGSTLYRRFQEILKSAGIPTPPGRTGRPFHALRGTCYKYWQRKGMPVEQIAELIGDTVDTAMKHYGKATLADLEQTMKI